MPTHWESRTEPIPGYRLVERLGRGGFGEVWKAEAPGGLTKAIKFVHGEIAGADGRHAAQELKALERVRGIRHPFILSMERFDVVDGQLLIVMEIADCNLEERLREHQKQGLPGIPRAELLGYLGEAAEALDLMSREYDLQHLDIKPQNLFLIGHHVKVADFGLVKDLEGCTASVTGGVTPVYAPPETFDGWVSRNSDQYSLAIVYQELLTGQRPFRGPSARQYMMQHLSAEPDLAMVPACDRPIVRRALSKDPKERYPTCTEFVDALKAAVGAGQITLDSPETDTVHASAGQIDLSTQLPEAQPADSPTTLRSSPVNRDAWKASSGGTLRPTLIIGLGQTGLETIDRLRAKLVTRFGEPNVWPPLAFTAIDVETAGKRNVETQGIHPEILEQTLFCRFRKPNQYFQEWEDLGHIARWLDPNLLFQIPAAGGTNAYRALGRLAFFENYRRIAVRVEAHIKRLLDPAHLESSLSATGQSLRTTEPRICIVGSMGGGIGSGMFLDTCYLARRILLQAGVSTPDVEGYLIAGIKGTGRSADLARINHYALAQDLLDYSQPDASFEAAYGADGPPQRFRAAPAKAIYFFDADAVGVPEPRMAAIEDQVADVLLHCAASAIGKELEQQERLARWPRHRSLGFFSLTCPARDLLARTAARLCQELAERWLALLGKSDAADLVESACRRISKAGFDPAEVSSSLLTACAERMQNPVPVVAANLLADVEASLSTASGHAQTDALQAGLARIHAIFGSDQEDESNSDGVPAFERALHWATNAVAVDMLAPLVESLTLALDHTGPRVEHARKTWEGYSQYLLGVIDQQQEAVRAEVQRVFRRARQIRERMQGAGSALASHSETTALRIRLLDEYIQGRISCKLREHVLQFYLVLRGKLSDWSRDCVRIRQAIEQLLTDLTEEIASRLSPVGSWSSQPVFPGGLLTVEEAAERLYEQVADEARDELDAWLQSSTISRLGGFCEMLRREDAFVDAEPKATSSDGKDASPSSDASGQVDAAFARPRLRPLPRTLMAAVMRWLQERISDTDATRAFFDRHASGDMGLTQEMTAFFEWSAPTCPYRPATQGADQGVDPTPADEYCVLSVPASHTGQRFAELISSIEGLPRPRVIADGQDCILCRVQSHDSLARMLPKWLLDARPAYDAARSTRLSPDIFPARS